MTNYHEIMYFVYRFSMAFELGFIVLFLPMKYQKVKTAVITITAFVVTAALDYIDFFVYNLMHGLANTLIQVILIQGAAILVSAYRDWRTVFTALCAANYVLVGNVIGTATYTFTGNIGPALVAEVVVHGGLLLLLSKSLRKKYHLELELFRPELSWLCAVPVLFYMVIYGMAAWPNTLAETPSISVPLLIVLVLMGVCYYYMIDNRRKLRAEMEKVSESNLLEQYAESVLHEAEMVRKHRDALAIQRHDLRHCYRLIQTYLEDGSYDEIRELTRQLDADLDAIKEHVYCENVTINGILSLYSDKAERAGVAYECRADVPCGFEQANDFGFATMLSNLLENALIAASNVADVSKRRMVVLIMPKKEQLILEIQNSTDKKLKISPETGFPIREHGGGKHGYGLISVTSYADAHGGLISFRQNGDVVTVRYITNL